MRRMIHQCMCLVIFLLVTICSAKGPVFCKQLDCPRYTVEKQTDEYEDRCYGGYNWVSTTVTGEQYKDAGTKAFMLLFKYISGENSKHEKIPMAMPVLIEIQHTSPGPFCAANFTISFFIAFDNQADPPAPTDDSIHITRLDAFCAYVHTFGGYMKLEPDIRDNVGKLTDALKKDGLGDTYRKDYFYAAAYDTPYVLYNRHNEIWFVKI